MVEKKVVGEGRLPPWEIAQPHPGRRETHHNQGWKLQFLSKSETGKEEPNISGKQFWFAFSQPLRRVRAPLGAVLVTVTLSLVPKQIINSILIIMNSQTQLFGKNSYICTIFFKLSKTSLCSFYRLLHHKICSAAKLKELSLALEHHEERPI